MPPRNMITLFGLYFKVPFIAFYRKEYVLPELKINDLWRVYHMDELYCKLQQRKQAEAGGGASSVANHSLSKGCTPAGGSTARLARDGGTVATCSCRHTYSIDMILHATVNGKCKMFIMLFCVSSATSVNISLSFLQLKEFYYSFCLFVCLL